jgi:hypothetical protein
MKARVIKLNCSIAIDEYVLSIPIRDFNLLTLDYCYNLVLLVTLFGMKYSAIILALIIVTPPIAVVNGC